MYYYCDTLDIKAHSKTVEDLFGQNQLYAVPLFQRSYSWDDSQTNEFFDDVLNAIGSSSNHFIGAMVFVTSTTGDRIKIIDGQQRFATLIVILCALRKVLEASSISSKVERTNMINGLVYVQDTVSLEKNTKLELNRDDKLFLEKIVKEGIVSNVDYSSHELIKKAYDYFVNELTTKVNNEGDEFVRKFLDTILRKLLFVKIEVDDYSSAFILFETLNDRGLDLVLRIWLRITSSYL